MTGNKDVHERMMRDYCEKYGAEHQRSVERFATVSGRFEKAASQSNGTDAGTLCKFIEDEYCYFVMGAPVCVIYMPEMYDVKKLTGKIIVELRSGDRDGGGDMYFEIQLAGKSEFASIKEEELEWIGWQQSYRYHNIFLDRASAVPFAQKLLFSGLFKQRFLMTTESRVLGSMTTQRLRSTSGHVFSFRRCVLNE